MKRIALAAATALMLAGPLAATASAQAINRASGTEGMYGRDDDRRDHQRGDRDRNDHDRGRGDNDRDWDRGDNDRDWDRGDRRRGDRGDHRRSRWNNERHNGYTYNGRWYYGPPPGAYEDRYGYEAGYRSWRRGERLPSYYQGRYRQVDYRREHLRAPPRGYRYVEDDRGDYLLVGIATGVILSIILSQ
jgi:Ni/Co efflux regulator RcnB